MHSGSFIANNSQIQQLDEFRRDVREKVYSRFEQSKNVLQQAKDTQFSLIQSILRRSISPKSPNNHSQYSPHHSYQQQPSPLRKSFTKNSPPRISFQRSSLDLGKSNGSSMLSYPKKNLQELLPINRILDLQKILKTQNYTASDSYMMELKKLAKIIQNE